MSIKIPIFSIVTPSFNQAQFIEETIGSVLSQKGDFAIQYIIADGGSTDGSIDIIKRYDALIKNEELNIRCKGITYTWWSRPDNGQSDAINRGFKKTKGDYVAWINSDDLYLPGAFQQAKEVLGSNPSLGLIYSDFDMVDEAGNVVEGKTTAEFSLSSLIHGGNFIGQPASFMRRSALIDVGLLNPKYHYAMDYDLWLRIGEKFLIEKVPGKWAQFRLHDQSKTVSLEKNFWKEVRTISREHGAKLTSPIIKHHYLSGYPRLLATLNRIGRAYLLIKGGRYREFIRKLLKNLGSRDQR